MSDYLIGVVHIICLRQDQDQDRCLDYNIIMLGPAEHSAKCSSGSLLHGSRQLLTIHSAHMVRSWYMVRSDCSKSLNLEL